MRGLAVLVLVGVVLASGTTGCVECPTALLEGTLIEDGNGGLAVQPETGPPIAVVWPDGHHVSVDAGTGRLVVIGPLGMVVAREGDHIRLGGGEDPEGPGFKGCGGVSVVEESPGG